MITKSQAKRLVTNIAEEHGCLSEDVLAEMDSDTRHKVESAMLKKNKAIGSAVVTLAKNLYSSKARFVFELLRNADGNSYTTARSRGETPYVAFQVHPDRIIVECNEDGFTIGNLRTICSVGKTSKTGTRAYSGLKGIGFKSVFMVACKVHVQSGPFSFSFSHKHGDSGMGMISPVWEESNDTPVSSTRFTLFLHQSGDAESLERIRNSIRQQLEEFQETFLLFLKNIKRLSVTFYDNDGTQTSSAQYAATWTQSTHAVTTRDIALSRNGPEEHRSSHFHVTTKQVSNLTRSENRIHSDGEVSTGAYSKSNVILAFPLTEDSVPVIRPQEVFAFLPVRHVGFNFLIQADFVTDASRQDIVPDSARNSELVMGIADVFLDAVRQFCQHDKLRYQWMRYLPDQSGGIHWDRPWNNLVRAIASKLSSTSVLYSEMQPKPQFICDLVRLPSYMRDEGNGRPLLDDDYSIVSEKYGSRDLDLLKNYGLIWADLNAFYAWLDMDLRQGHFSRMRSSRSTPSWHKQTATLLNRMLELQDRAISNGFRESLRKLPLLPLQNGVWTSIASSNQVYFAQTGGMTVPSGIDLALVSTDVTCAERLKLFRNLGVTEVATTVVREQILQKYTPIGRGPATQVSLAESKEHLQFLYETEHVANGSQELLYSNLAIHTQSIGVLYRPFEFLMYTASTEAYGPWELLKPTVSGSGPGSSAPGLANAYVNDAYFGQDAPSKGDRTLTWLEWFHEKLNVEAYVRITDGDSLTIHGKYLQTHRPDKFVNALRIHFEHSKTLEPKVIQELLEMEVLCEGNVYRKLSQTVFPTTDLKSRAARFVEPSAVIPWLHIDDTTIASHDAIPASWKPLLTKLGLAKPADLDFALHMLCWSREGYPERTTSSSRARFYELYSHVNRCCAEAPYRLQAMNKIRTFFSEKEYIYIPLEQGGHTWASPGQCVWNASQAMASKYALHHLYAPCFIADGADINQLSNLFTSVLGIGDCTWKIYLKELKALRESSCKDVGKIRKIYESLDSLTQNMDSTSKEAVKAAFNDGELIYVHTAEGGPEWHTILTCVWSAAGNLGGEVSLDEDYGKLMAFFVGFLGVKPIDIQMAVDELKEARSPAQQKQNSTSKQNSADISATKDILSVPRSLTDETLESIGIAAVDCIENTDEPTLSESDSPPTTPNRESSVSGSIDLSDTESDNTLWTPSSSVVNPPLYERSFLGALFGSGGFFTPRRLSAHTPSTASTTPRSAVSPDAARNTAYVALLGKAMASAQAATIPIGDAPKSQRILDNSPLDVSVQSASQIERDPF